MSYLRATIEYMTSITLESKPISKISGIDCETDDPMLMPMEHLEARICELAGHMAAATCRYLLLVADFDEREGWRAWDMPSCAAWLSWKCQVAPGTAREQVRVARALKHLPVIRGELAAGRFSYAKARALTRIATPQTEEALADMAESMTAAQVERFATAHRKVSSADDAKARASRRLTWRFTDDGMLAISGRLSPEDGAVLLQALRACRDDLEHPHDRRDGDGHDDDGHEGETHAQRLQRRDEETGTDLENGDKPGWLAEKVPAEDLADALAEVCTQYPRSKIAAASNPDAYQVIIHAGAAAITEEPGEPAEPDVSAETPTWHPARQDRCHVEDGQAISATALRLIGCNATISTMLHDADGSILAVGRRTRTPSDALRRAARERDQHRCRFPGCRSRKIDLHHVRYWSNGGPTSLDNLISLCKRHHRLVHDKGYIITSAREFHTPQGTLIPNSPPPPHGTGDITTSHDAAIAYHTIVPPYSGERLNLNDAIWICFANAKVQAARREQLRQAA